MSETQLKLRYEVNDELSTRTLNILKVRLPELADALFSNFLIFFTNAEFEHWGGECRLNPAPTRFGTKVEFIIVIKKAEYQRLSEEGKNALICHELYHITRTEKDVPKLRKHKYMGGIDFCELPEHDGFSHQLALKVMGKI